MHIFLIHLLLQQTICSLLLQIIKTICDDDGCGCVEPVFIFNIQMVDFVVVVVVVGSVFDPMSDDLFGCGVGLVDSVVAGEGE